MLNISPSSRNHLEQHTITFLMKYPVNFFTRAILLYNANPVEFIALHSELNSSIYITVPNKIGLVKGINFPVHNVEILETFSCRCLSCCELVVTKKERRKKRKINHPTALPSQFEILKTGRTSLTTPLYTTLRLGILAILAFQPCITYSRVQRSFVKF